MKKVQREHGSCQNAICYPFFLSDIEIQTVARMATLILHPLVILKRPIILIFFRRALLRRLSFSWFRASQYAFMIGPGRKYILRWYRPLRVRKSVRLNKYFSSREFFLLRISSSITLSFTSIIIGFGAPMSCSANRSKSGRRNIASWKRSATHM